jgi:hypothetical protein
MLVVYAVILLGVGALAFFIAQPEGRQSVLFLNPYTYLQKIKHDRPDLILVGNSWLQVNVDRTLLNTLLSNMEHRPVHVLFAAESGRPNAWFYVMLKNQIAASGHSEIPVGLFFAGNSFMGYNRHLDGAAVWAVGKLMTQDEPALLRKTRLRQPAAGLLANYRPDLRAIGQFLLNTWANSCSVWIPGQHDAKRLIEARFQIKASRPFEVFKLVADQPPEAIEQKDFGCEDIRACVDQTLLPDMIQAMKGFRFFVVDVARNPSYPATKNLVYYRRDLKTYLSAHGVEYVALVDRPELGNSAFFRDEFHLLPEGQPANTRLLAQIIHERHLLKQPKR